MDAFEYNANPGRVIFGSGTLQKLPDEIARVDKKAPLILSTPQQVSQAEHVKEVLKGQVAGVFTEATMHTPTHITDKAVEYAKAQKADVVVSIGGGSTIGLGKAISIRTGLYHICIPTTYAGSEMTPILGETADGLKKTRSDPKILPGTVIYDVDLTMTLPSAMSATSGVNAIAHAVEALYARNTNPVINLMAVEGTRALASALPEIVENPSSQSARSLALYGAWLCGTCLGSVGMSIHHKLCHTLGGSFNLPHAETHTAVLPHAISYNAPNIPEAMKKLAEVLPESNGDAIHGLNVLLEKLKVKRGVKDFGMKEEDIDKAADIAVSNPYWNPRPIERAPIRELIRRVMTTELEAAPVLSTPDNRILEETEPVVVPETNRILSEEELAITYDIERTLKEIRQARYKRIALQFPDEMLPDAPRVFQLLSRGLEAQDIVDGSAAQAQKDGSTDGDGLANSVSRLDMKDGAAEPAPKLYILADTSYGTCCVDEVAAEHVDADVVVHYGRSCLSPTARLPVIYVFTHKPLPLHPLVKAFKETYPDVGTKVILAADVTYSDHVPEVYSRLVQEGYTNLFATELVHDPSSLIPNRTVPDSVKEAPESLSDWQLFHISEPPTALLLTLASRVAAIHIYPTDGPADKEVKPLPASTAAALRRRYAILTRLSTVPIFGILVNTLSVKNYLHIVEHVKEKIAAAGKKSYMFVVGKLNAAKVANFSEIGGWVVIGCWESSLVDSKDFWKPVITPFELEFALKGDDERVWTGAWQSDFQSVLDQPQACSGDGEETNGATHQDEEKDDDMSEPESAPPEFDFRTGRYVSHTRPMRESAARVSAESGSKGANAAIAAAEGPSAARALARRAKGDLAMIGGSYSPGAEFLRSQRTWTGLGSDFDSAANSVQYDSEGADDSTLVVEGRKGIARGYTVGDSMDKH
ncbi:hypothetical protein BJX61DRAFT_530679 [Aspergillus egyptiacus]|nr:hypothetical protein BJX61DRAFT_530679 [Aspergillus egyptiacus]